MNKENRCTASRIEHGEHVDNFVGMVRRLEQVLKPSPEEPFDPLYLT
jgi:hypothetical protein